MISHKTLISLLNYCYNKDQNIIPEEWDILLDSELSNKNLHGFKATAFINHTAKQITIVHSWANFNLSSIEKLYYDLNIWLDIYYQHIPEQFSNGGVYFLHKLQNELEASNLESYKIINTGYSTGAVNSDLATVYFLDKGFGAFSIAYESPGSRPIIEQFISEKNLNADLQLEYFQVFNTHGSIINKLNDHYGNITKIDDDIILESSTFLSKAAATLHKIGDSISITSKIYHLYTCLKNNFTNLSDEISFHSNAQCLAIMNIFSLLSNGLIKAGIYIEDADKAFNIHNFEHIKTLISDKHIFDESVFPEVQTINQDI